MPHFAAELSGIDRKKNSAGSDPKDLASNIHSFQLYMRNLHPQPLPKMAFSETASEGGVSPGNKSTSKMRDSQPSSLPDPKILIGKVFT